MNEVFLTFRRQDMRRIMMQVFEDIRFLSKLNLMDYSLLLIVETNPAWKKEIAKANQSTLKRKSKDRRNTVTPERAED